MRSFQYAAAISALTAIASASPSPYSWKPKPKRYGALRPAVGSEELQASISGDALYAHETQLQNFAYAYPEGNRLAGGQAHNDTVTYIYNTLTALDYYDVTLQPLNILLQLSGNASFWVDGGLQPDVAVMDYSPSGNVTAPLVLADNLGCNQTDYPDEAAGNIVLISRGTCAFGLKSVYAGLAGAIGAVEYNNVAGNLSGTLGTPRDEGPYVPTIGISQELGLSLVDAIEAGESPVATLDVSTDIQNITSFNVLAQTKGGDPNNTLILGGHSDSVAAGPGINDNGSGSAGILEVAVQLSNFTTANGVRFGWWTAEEEGLLGSTYYVSTLSAADLAALRLMLNFDMIASPNYYYAIYDGDGDAFNTTAGPAGSAQAEELFQTYFTSRDLPYAAAAFDGRSDYGPFLDAGVACGGLFTGAEDNKTDEEAALFGGEAGVAYDVNYHGPGDTLDNLNMTAFVVNVQAIAHAVATYATSFESLEQRGGVAERGVAWSKRRDAVEVATKAKMYGRDGIRNMKKGKVYG